MFDSFTFNVFIDIVVQSLGCVWLFATPWTTARQAFLSFPISMDLLKLMSIESVMPSNHLILCCPLLPLPSIFPSIRVLSNKSALHIRWPKLLICLELILPYFYLLSICLIYCCPIVFSFLAFFGLKHTHTHTYQAYSNI